MTIALYLPGATPLHRLSAGAKVAGLLAASLALFLVPSPGFAVATIPAALALYVSTGATLRRLVADMRGPALLIGFVFLFQLLFGSAEDAMLVAARFSTLILLAAAVTLTTPVSAMADLVEWLLAPLARFGLRPDKVGLAIALAIRFVPLIAEEYREIREAQAARGLGRNPLALVVPLLIRTFKAADELADAIEARGYDT